MIAAMSPCTRNCWIFAALMGLVVWLFALTAGGVGAMAGLFLGFVTAWLLGGFLVMMFCTGRGGEAADDQLGWLHAAPAAPAPTPLPDAPPIALAARPAGMEGAPAGASADSAAAVTFAADPTLWDDEEEDEYDADDADGDGAVAPAAETPLEDTRAVMDAPSASARHDMPGEAVPSAEPKKAKKPKDKVGKSAKDAKDAKEKGRKAKDRADKTGRKGLSTDASRVLRARAEDVDGGEAVDDPFPVATVTTPATAAGGGDELGRIDGIGPNLTEWLHGQGVTRLAQIAAWTEADVDDFEARLGRSGGRIRRDDWVGQARILAAGGETAHSRRVDSGEAT